MKLTEALILSLDTETTGPDPKHDRIVEIGGGYLQAGQQVGPMLRALVDPERYIPAGATQVHGIRNEDVEDAPKWPVVAERLKKHLDADPVIVGYNILGFDAPIIDNENQRCDIDWRMPRSLDPFVWVMWYDRGVTVKKLGITCERYGVSLPEDRAHTADADAFATGLLLTSMIIEGIIPDDVEWAFAEQLALREKLAAEYAEYGRAIFPDRETGIYRLGMGKHCGVPIDEADEGYLKWLAGRPDLTDKARGILKRTLGEVEQIGLF
ncbi:MAG: exonuclease domain-containing protein [Bradymonadia bacterium]